MKRISLILLFIFISNCYAQQDYKNIAKILDSVEANYMTTDLEKSLTLLNSLGLENNSIKNENLIRYYAIKYYAYNANGQNKIKEDEFLSKAILVANELKNENWIGELHLNLARTQMNLLLYKEAEKNFEISYKSYKKLNDTTGILMIELSRCEILYQQKEYDKSIAMLKKFEPQFLKSTDIFLESHYYVLLGQNYLKKSDLNNAFKTVYDLRNNPLPKAEFSQNSYNESEKDYHETFLSSLIALDVLKRKNREHDSFIEELITRKKPYDFQLIEYRYEIAAKYYLSVDNKNLYGQYNDSLISFLQDKNDAVNISLGTRNHELMQKDSKLLQIIKEKTWLLTFLLSLLLLIIGSIIFIKKKHKKYAIQIEGFEDQSTTIETLEDVNKKLNANLVGVKQYIQELKKETKILAQTDDIELQKAKIVELHSNVKSNEFNLFNSKDKHLDVINELNAPFFNSLSKQYPTLTDSEKLICYFIIMDFKSGEIATFLNTSIRAIESKRYRISKKINPENDLQLKDVLVQFAKNLDKK